MKDTCIYGSILMIGVIHQMVIRLLQNVLILNVVMSWSCHWQQRIPFIPVKHIMEQQ